MYLKQKTYSFKEWIQTIAARRGVKEIERGLSRQTAFMEDQVTVRDWNMKESEERYSPLTHHLHPSASPLYSLARTPLSRYRKACGSSITDAPQTKEEEGYTRGTTNHSGGRR
jgi:hypothetical protein